MVERQATAIGLIWALRVRRRILVLASLIVVIAAGVLVAAAGSRSRPSVDELRERAVAAAQLGNWREADAALKQIAEPTPVIWLLRAATANNLNDHDSAIAYLLRVPTDGDLGTQAALLEAKVELARFRARPLEKALRRALELDPKLDEARWMLLDLYGTQGRRRLAVDQYRVLAERSPPSHDLLRQWCNAHLEYGVISPELAPILQRYVETDPEDRWSRLGLAHVYRRLLDYERAHDVLRPLPETDPDARAARAEIELDRGNLSAAASLLAEGPEKHIRLARLRGRLALILGDGPKAVRCLRVADELEPNHWETLYRLAQALRLVGDRAAAESYTRRSDAHRRLRDLTLLHIAEKDEPTPLVACRVAAACEAADYLPEARAWYQFALRYDPFNEKAQKALFRLSTPDGASSSTSRAIGAPSR
jgi:tetratricopeptide (TPR) repeat protein